MNKKIKQTSCAITGAAVLLVVAAGNVQAITISPLRNPGVTVRAPQQAPVNVTSLGNQIMTPINPVAVLVSGPQIALVVGVVRAPAPVGNRGRRVIAYTPPAAPVITPATPRVGAVGVADGGATLLMLGGAMTALVLVQRKLKVKPSH